jgi:hypothetical protein
MTLDGTPLKKNSIHLCGYYVGRATTPATAAAQERKHR